METKGVLLFLCFLSFLLLGVRGQGQGANVQYVNKCPVTTDIYDSNLGRIASLAPGTSFTQHYAHDVAFNAKVGANGLSLAEFTIDTVGFYDLDWYDISIIVGYDYPLSINAPASCGADANFDVICTSNNCGPPQAYKVWNDDAATHSCNSKGGTYIVTWCPTNPDGTPSYPVGYSGGGSSSSSSSGSSTPTSAPPSGSPPSSGRLQSKSTGKFVTLDGGSNLVATATSADSATLFTFTPNQYGYTIKAASFVSADNYGANPLVANRPTADTWESFTFTQAGSYWEIKSYINNNYVAVQSNSQLQATQSTSGTIPDSAQFSIV